MRNKGLRIMDGMNIASNKTLCQIGTTGKGMPCLANIYTLAGIIQPCEVCAPTLPKMRKLMEWTPFRGRFYMSNKLTTDQHNRLLDAIDAETKYEDKEALQ
jgi:hypothetical protein